VNRPGAFLSHFFQNAARRAIVKPDCGVPGVIARLISRVLREEGLPAGPDLPGASGKRLPAAGAFARGRAGIWQFVAYRGQQYGLRHTWWIDERQDPEKPRTPPRRASSRPLQAYGDWYLAMAAYNCGPGKRAKGHRAHRFTPISGSSTSAMCSRAKRKNYVPIISR